MNTYLNFGNAKCFDFVRECLNACVVDHDCGCDDPPQLPTRLLDVDTSDPKRICLVATADLLAAGENVEKFTALSYCWGPVDAFTTTPALLAERMEGIAVADMPDTLRDAFSSPENSAAATYGSTRFSVYGQAFCTIVAAWSRDCYGGLFHITQPSDSGRLSSGRSLELFKDQPINSRAWALQEWLLSPRLLVYTHNDLLFFSGRTMLSKNQLDYSAAWHMHPIYKYRLPRYPAQPALDQWFNMVQNYSARDLTDPEDMLPAIAGLARRFHDLTGTSSGQYLAGMWREDLFASLLWRRQDAWGAFLAIPDHSVLEWYRAPSWSWAAGDGLV
ncbi:hypothetical protein GQ53DRAFT_805782 [Thozetella sp. PMI_491]|nr:hypothetical protein GQ53DRAFT_805782 [Thozetella sp. PMI_491]